MKKIILIVVAAILTTGLIGFEKNLEAQSGGSKNHWQIKKDASWPMKNKSAAPCAPNEMAAPRSFDFGSHDSRGTVCVPRCAEHFQFLFQNDETTDCRPGFVGPPRREGDPERDGGYTCRAIADYVNPPLSDSTLCPTGTQRIDSNDWGYACQSYSPILEGERHCAGDYIPHYREVDATRTADGVIAIPSHYVLECAANLSANSCSPDPDATETGWVWHDYVDADGRSRAVNDHCCVYLKCHGMPARRGTWCPPE